MKIKLTLNGGLGYFFSGPVALSVKNNVKNPLTIDSDTLSDKDILSLARAAKSGTIKIVEGEKEFLEKAYHIASESKSKKLVKSVLTQEVASEIKEEVKELEPEPEVIVELKEETPEPTIEEEKPVSDTEVTEVVKPTRAKRTTTKK